MNTSVQGVLMAVLASQGQHDAAQQALETTDRAQWHKLADLAIRTAPEFNRTHVAHVVWLALDDPTEGGPGLAEDFAVLPEPNKLTGEMWYRGYRCPEGIGAGKPHYDTGLYWRDPAMVYRRIVGLYKAVRTIQLPQEAPCHSSLNMLGVD